MPPKRNPEDRAESNAKRIARVRRKYKTNVRTKRKYAKGEEAAIAVNVAVFKIAGYSNTQIAEIVGISRGQVAAHLANPDTEELLVTLRDSLSNAALDLLEQYQIEAIQAIVDVMRSSEDDGMILKAAADILDRAGIPKVSRSEKKVENEHTATFTDDGIVEAIRELSPEAQEQAAQMIEQLENFLESAAKEAIEEEVEDESS